VKHRALLVVAGLIGAVTLVASLSVAAAGTSRPAAHAAPVKSAAIAPPAVPNAAAIKAKYKGQKITFVGDGAVGSSHKRDLKLVARIEPVVGLLIRPVGIADIGKSGRRTGRGGDRLAVHVAAAGQAEREPGGREGQGESRRKDGAPVHATSLNRNG
jgi:hypothetical protein